MSCSNELFPFYKETITTELLPGTIFILIPSSISFLLWLLLWCTKFRFITNVNIRIFFKLLAIFVSLEQGLLLYRIFEVFACEDLLPNALSAWVFVAIAILAALHFVLIFICFDKFPFLTSGFVIDLGFVCVACEFLGRTLLVTNAVQYLFPFQLGYGILSICVLFHAKGNPVTLSLPHVSKKKNELKTIDPLQRRTEESRWFVS